MKKYVIDNSYNESYGARPIKRFIQKYIETVIAKAIISSEIVPYVTYIIDVLDGKVIIKQVK